MRDQGHCLGAGAGADGDDVGDARAAPERRAAGVRFLHADFEAEEPQLVDDVGAGAGVGLGADRTAADRAGKHADVGAGVLLGEDRHGPGTAGSPGSNVRGDEQNGEAEEMLDLTTPHLR